MKNRNFLLFYILFFLLSCNTQTKTIRNEVFIRLPADPENLSPVNYSNVRASQILNLLYQSLLTVDLADNTVKPLLVKALPKITKIDSLSYFSFELREQATWDNGSPITAEDVALTLKIIHNPLLENTSTRSNFDFIKDIEFHPSDKKKFSLICAGYSPDMEFLVGDFFVLPSYLVDPDSLLFQIPLSAFTSPDQTLENRPEVIKHAKFFNTERFTRDPKYLVGSGGYLLANWKTGQSLTLKRKEAWWGDKTDEPSDYIVARPQEINFLILPDNSSALLALKNQQVDVFENIPTKEFNKLGQDGTFTNAYRLYTPEVYDFAFVGLNSRLPKLTDVETRCAIAHLFDIENIIKATQDDFATPTVGPISPADLRFYHAGIKPYAFSIQRAEDLLSQAGWVKKEDGWYRSNEGKQEALTLTIAFKAGNTVFENTALIFQQAAAAAAIPVTVVPLEGSQLTGRIKNHEYEMFIRSITGSPLSYNFRPLFHTESAGQGGMNFTGFGNPESDDLIESISQAEDEKEKARLLRRLQEILHEQCTMVFLYFNKNRIAIHNRFTDVKVSGIKPGYDVSAFSLRKQ